MGKIIFHGRSNPNFLKVGFLISLCLVGIVAWPQRIPTELWIVIDPADSLCVDMRLHAYRFYRDDKSFFLDFGTPGGTARYDTIFKLPRNKKIVNRYELFLMLDKLPKKSDKNTKYYQDPDDGWYYNAFSTIYFIEKRDCYYLKSKVEKVSIFD